jgi:flagellar transcriptional activator FlhC
VSPPKGMLPFSTDWFLTWQPNIHSSLYINIYKFLVDHAGATGIQAVMKAYKLYLEQMPPEPGEEPLLSLTRAWTLVRFFQGGMLMLAPCSKCKGKYVVNSLDLNTITSAACATCLRAPARPARPRTPPRWPAMMNRWFTVYLPAGQGVSAAAPRRIWRAPAVRALLLLLAFP